jgi:hypothetical protein
MSEGMAHYFITSLWKNSLHESREGFLRIGRAALVFANEARRLIVAVQPRLVFVGNLGAPTRFRPYEMDSAQFVFSVIIFFFKISQTIPAVLLTSNGPP